MSGVQLPATLSNGNIESTGGHSMLKSAMGSDTLEPIALIGLDMKFAQDVVSAESFWRLLIEGRSAMTEVPKDRFNLNAFYHSDATRTNAVCTSPSVLNIRSKTHVGNSLMSRVVTLSVITLQRSTLHSSQSVPQKLPV